MLVLRYASEQPYLLYVAVLLVWTVVCDCCVGIRLCVARRSWLLIACDAAWPCMSAGRKRAITALAVD